MKITKMKYFYTINDIYKDRNNMRLNRSNIVKNAYLKAVRGYSHNGRRRFDDTMISLMHFNYPYTDEPGDGMRDEVGKLNWTKFGNAKFVGTEQPVAEVVTDTPKFGWRCLQTAANTDYLYATNDSGLLNISKTDNKETFEVEMFIRITSLVNGNILTLLKSNVPVFTISVENSKISVIADGINATTSSSPTISAWTHLFINIYDKKCKIFMDGNLLSTAAITGGTIEANEIRLGGIVGQIDEFKLNMNSSELNPIVPLQPYQNIITQSSIGGFGTGSLGDVTISSANTNINTTAIIQTSDQQSFTIGSSSVGTTGQFVIGDKVMIHVSLNKTYSESKDLGKFSIREITNVIDNVITLNSPIDEFILNTSNYYIQIIKIPQYNTLTVSSNGSIVPDAWNTSTGGGLVALTTKSDCTITGNITTVKKGIERNDNSIFCHDDLQDRFLLTGNVFILCNGILTVSGYLGGDWDGSLTSGAGGSGGASPRSKASGGNGAAGKYSGGGYAAGGGGGGGGAS